MAVPKSAFHGFYYTSLPSKKGKLYTLPLSKTQTTTFKRYLKTSLEDVTDEKYWRSFGRFMQTHAPSGYIAWEGKIYWIVLLPKVGANHKYVDDTHGLHIIEISPGKFRHRWIEHPEDNDSDEAEAMNSIVYTPWDWMLEGEHSDDEKPMSKPEQTVMKANIGWTDEVHERMNKKFPADKCW